MDHATCGGENHHRQRERMFLFSCEATLNITYICLGVLVINMENEEYKLGLSCAKLCQAEHSFS